MGKIKHSNKLFQRKKKAPWNKGFKQKEKCKNVYIRFLYKEKKF